MKFPSTRALAPPASLGQALAAGLAPDGGLYVPEALPAFSPADFDGLDELPAVAARLLQPFFNGDPLAAQLPAICREAFAVAPPLRAFGAAGDYVLELFHGPTAAFKDYGARFLAACLARIRRGAPRPLTILVATSGDTGAAVAAAFHGQPGLRVVVLYPDGRVSPRQAHQLGCFGDNVRAFRVDGSFDDCQRLVKSALSDPDFRAEVPLGSANSISLGRLLPQMSYYADAALRHHATTGKELNFVIPTGNLGNAMAAVLARALGIPLGRIVLATNANRVLPDYFAGGDYAPAASVATIANAMDVGAPSNFERLRWFYRGDDVALRAAFSSASVSDEAIREVIQRRHAHFGEVFCPHTATAVSVLEGLRAASIPGYWAVAATAHPAKFESIVEPLIGRALEVPPALDALLQRRAQALPMPPDYDALHDYLLAS